MLYKLFSDKLLKIFSSKILYKDLTEIRIRKDKPIIVFLKSQPYYIYDNGITCNKNDAIFATKEMIDEIVYRASEYSIYSVNEQIKQGFIMLDNGIRIGLCGTVVYDGDNVKTINNWTSLNIRIPHQIKNISLSVFDDIVDENGVNNTLIISPPGAGKTTFLRDIVLQLSNHNYCLNVSIIDERGEICGVNSNAIDLGLYCDVMTYCSKRNGILKCLRTMSPNLIVTDEIASIDDAECLIEAMDCGVNVITTIHANSIQQLKNKPVFSQLPNMYFKRYILLSLKNGPGTIEGIYNEKFAQIVKW